MMRWPRDVAEEAHISIRSAKSLLTVTTHVTVVWMDVDPTVVRDSPTFSDVTGALATMFSSVAEIAIAIVITAIMDTGVVTSKREAGILDTLHTHSHNDLPGILRMWRNWQTRRSQKPVMVTSWRFKSSHPHQQIEASLLIQTRPFSSFLQFPHLKLKIFVTDFRSPVFSY